jgi:hypothetical protein
MAGKEKIGTFAAFFKIKTNEETIFIGPASVRGAKANVRKRVYQGIGPLSG